MIIELDGEEMLLKEREEILAGLDGAGEVWSGATLD